MEHLGRVLIVGAGPGAADLITLRGLRALRQADVVLYDALVNLELLSEAPEHAERIFVGKRCGKHAMEQPEINRRLVAEARAGKTVVRLKGGDPLVFGRGGEEALACEEAGVPFELVPGISSALGAASCAGIPLTHRGVARSVAFVTAQHGGDDQVADHRLASLLESADTVVIFMGGSRIGPTVESLVASGIPGNLPTAVVSQATLATQKTVVGTLDCIVERVRSAELATPMLIVLGPVTNLCTILNRSERPQSTMATALSRKITDMSTRVHA